MISYYNLQERLKHSRVPFIAVENGDVVSKSGYDAGENSLASRNPYSCLMKSQREALTELKSGDLAVIDLPKRAKRGRTLVTKSGDGYIFLFPVSLSRSEFISSPIINEKILPSLKMALSIEEDGKKLPDIFRALSENVLSVSDAPLDVFLRIASSALRFLCGDDMLTVTGEARSLYCTPDVFSAFGELCSELLLSDNTGNEYRAEAEISEYGIALYLDGLKVSEVDNKSLAFSSVRPYLFSSNEEIGALILALVAELCVQ